MHPMLIVSLVGTVFLLLAWGLWALVRSWDRQNAVLAAAPALPIRLVTVHDDVWVRGDIECPAPVVVPHFHTRCVHYAYRLEEHVRKTRTTSDGKSETYYEWETRQTDDGGAPFSLNDHGHVLHIDPSQARFEHEPALTETLGSWRHSCNYTPFPGTVSAVGVVDEDKRSLVPFHHVPLVITPKERAQYLADAESSERWAAWFGLAFLWIGFLLVGFGLVRYFQTGRELLGTTSWWDPWAGILAFLIALTGTTFCWSLRVYNSLVTFKVRADGSWSSIDVELKQRYDLLPNLVAIVKASQTHEEELFTRIARLRTVALEGSRKDRVWMETEAVAGVQQLFALSESYPDLKATRNYQQLIGVMTALEEKIAHARTVYNEAVKEYNLQAISFPANVVARLCRFDPYPLFAAELDEKQTPRVQLGATSAS